MESTGEEKKLQALYSELKAADEQSAPRFARVWNRATSKPRRARSLIPAFAATAACLVCAAGLLFAWSRYSQRAPTPVAQVQTNTPPVNVNQVETPDGGSKSSTTTTTQSKPKPRQANAVIRRQATQLAATRELTREAKAISDWQSPTSTLLSFTDDELFTSLPQLNENATDLKSFLPNSPK